MANLGKLQKVELREVWKHEARDFSAWLSQPENMEFLSETLGMDLGFLGAEVEVGRYRIDVLARDLNTDHKVIIENQLEPTNHDHLGKIITYASGLDAKYLIWIVKDVLPEHQKAVEWLNEYLDEEIRIFLIRIEVWQIGDSNYAPKFEIVAAKNDWAAAVKGVSNTLEFSETKLKQQQFWIEMSEYIRGIDSVIRLQKPLPQHWFNFSFGSSVAHLSLTINTRDSRFTCDFYIPNNKSLYSYLRTRENELFGEFKNELHWFEAEKASGFRIHFPVEDVFDEGRREQYFKMLYENVIDARNVMTRYVEEFRIQLED